MASALRKPPGRAAGYIRSERPRSTRLIPASTVVTGPADRPRRCAATSVSQEGNVTNW